MISQRTHRIVIAVAPWILGGGAAIACGVFIVSSPERIYWIFGGIALCAIGVLMSYSTKCRVYFQAQGYSLKNERLCDLVDYSDALEVQISQIRRLAEAHIMESNPAILSISWHDRNFNILTNEGVTFGLVPASLELVDVGRVEGFAIAVIRNGEWKATAVYVPGSQEEVSRLIRESYPISFIN